MNYANRVKDSKFSRNERGDLIIENAVIFWTNFKGEPTQFNSEGGKRTFNVGIAEELVDELKAEGWNIKCRPPYDPDDDPLYYTEAILNMKSKYEPRVMLCTDWRGEQVMRRLHGDDVSQLQGMRFSNVDLQLRPHVHERGRKGYCNILYVSQARDDLFGGKYDKYGLYQFDSDNSNDDAPFYL